jgi:integrase
VNKATVNLFLDTRATASGFGIVKWLITAERKQRLYITSVKISLDEWEFLQKYKAGLSNKVKDEERRQLWTKLYGDTFIDRDGKKYASYLIRAQDILNKLSDEFTFEAFDSQIKNYGKEAEPEIDKTDLIQAILDKGAVMRKADRIGNAMNYESAAKSLRRFVDSFSDEERKEFLGMAIPNRKKIGQLNTVETLRFKHLTPDFLAAYEQWMQHYGKSAQSPHKTSTGASLTTVGIYLRHVRAVVNEAIQQGILSHSLYPFGPGRYVIPAGTNTKKALAKSDIDRLKEFECIPNSMEQRSLDLWLFSYYCNGANLTDICHLTWGNVDMKGGKLSFIRQKTARSKKQKQTSITAYLRPETLAIIERLGTVDRSPSNYVFPYLKPGMDANHRKKEVQQVIKITNKWMNRIAESLGIDGDVNTYAARHSFATVLLKSKASLAFISKQLGHTNLKTTESYLGSFDDDEAKEFLSAL